jgi:hypothetical protein
MARAFDSDRHRDAKIPLDYETHLPHNCKFRPWLKSGLKAKTRRCNYCDLYLFFDPEKETQVNGKLIPQGMWRNHKCRETRIIRF